MTSSGTVLIVDDAPENILAAKGILAGHYTVKVATNGAKALDIARSSLPDIILLDIVMPEMDGYEVCRRLKEHEATRDIPVIFVSALSETANEERGFALGGVDYISRPISPSIMLARVRTHIELRRTSQLRAREQVLLAQKEAFEHLTAVADGIPALIAHVDAGRRYVYVNRSYAEWLGLDEESIVGRPVEEVLPEEIYRQSAPYMERVLRGEPCSIEQVVTVDGAERFMYVNLVPQLNEQGAVKSFFVLVTDLTDLRRVTEQLRHSQKMEAVGQLAGGVAHDFNNILRVISGYCQLLQLSMPEEDPHRTYVDLVAGAAERAGNLTQTLLAFCRKEPLELQPVDLNPIVYNAEKFIRRIIGEDIQVTVSLYDRPLTVLADGGQIEQVLLNLATNARDAMPAGGTFTLSLELHEVGALPARQWSCEPGHYARITAADSGIGMDDGTLNRIFEPFYTTKESGKGTGLGLSVVYGIVKQHNGTIIAASEPGRGSRFTLLLPLYDYEVPESQPDARDVSVQGNETLLIAEDDEATRGVLEQALAWFGYRTIMAGDGLEAVRCFEEAGGSVDLVILDVLMPEMNGKEAAEQIRRLQPDARILFMSGYGKDILQTRGSLDDSDDLFVKPVNLPVFLKKIRNILDGGDCGS